MQPSTIVTTNAFGHTRLPVHPLGHWERAAGYRNAWAFLPSWSSPCTVPPSPNDNAMHDCGWSLFLYRAKDPSWVRQTRCPLAFPTPRTWYAPFRVLGLFRQNQTYLDCVDGLFLQALEVSFLSPELHSATCSLLALATTPDTFRSFLAPYLQALPPYFHEL